MSEEMGFELRLEHLDGYAFRVELDWDSAGDLVLDEPAPLGRERGPNAARLVAAAAANCLSASLMFCIAKTQTEPGSITARVRGRLERNERKRLRIAGLEVELAVSEALAGSGRLDRCLALFEDFCVVTSSLRSGFPVSVQVRSPAGELLHNSDSD